MEKIIVVFKTHLDIGFTNFAENITDCYMKEYIPNALKVAREMRGEKERFVWTTGSWLIEKYLEEGEEKELLEDAVRHGEIRWHGLPFTTHTELMNSELFTYGLGISKNLDQRFGMKTIAAKLTDVPGHTKAMIPHLYQAGIRFLHIGVNPASTKPDVPDLFRWRADSGEEITVMYNGDYGKLTAIGKSGAAVYFAHTGDNRGPQSVEEIRAIYRKLHEQYPEAEILSGTLEDVAEIAVKEELEVLTEEIGDTWIHGAGTDPKKINQFHALLRLKNQLPEEEMKKIYKETILIPEHTWGLDEKMWLGQQLDNGELVGEHRYFKKEEFKVAKETEKFLKMEKSWQEQRNYLVKAVEQLSGTARDCAEKAMQEAQREITDVTGYERIQPREFFKINGWQIELNEKGAFCYLEKGNKILADDSHRIGKFVYEVFSEKEYKRFKKQYMITEDIWAVEDFGKIGLGAAVLEYKRYEPEQVDIWRKENVLVIQMKLPEEAVHLYGGMRLAEMKVEFGEENIEFDFAWFGKEESRVPEAVWLGFQLRDEIQWIEKMGGKINPQQVVSKGNRKLHAVEEIVKLNNCEFHTIDAPLVNIGEPGMLNFADEVPQLNQGFYVNLYNNTWGTNFPMWYGEDARFRFVLKR